MSDDNPPIPRPDRDELIPLSQLVKYIPPSARGRRRHASTVYRYALRGVRGFRLETQQLPDGRYTTLGAWDRFVERLSAGQVMGSGPAPAERGKKQSAVEAEIERVRATIRASKATELKEIAGAKSEPLRRESSPARRPCATAETVTEG